LGRMPDLSTAVRKYCDMRENHRDTKTQRHKERPRQTDSCSRPFFVPLCLCVSVVLSYVTVFANGCTELSEDAMFAADRVTQILESFACASEQIVGESAMR